MNKKLKGLNYYGGKSPSKATSKWIAKQIGFEYEKGYMEPFCGMLGILLSRPRAKIEIVNDLDSNLVNWWECVRDNPDELAQLVHHTPRSREIFTEAIGKLQTETDKLKKALWYHIVLSQSINQSTMKMTSGRWGIHYSGTAKTYDVELFADLADRLRYTQIENRDATKVLERASLEDSFVIYCDPPYYTSDMSPYVDNKNFDKDKFTELFKAQKSDVAISGYSNEWDHLGWVRTTHKSRLHLLQTPDTNKGLNNTDEVREREEVLWTNFEPRGYVSPEFDEIFT